MTRLQKLMQAINELDTTVYRLVADIVRDNETEIVELNSQTQLYEQGINANGKKIASYRPYAPLTVKLKKLKGQPTNRVTLRDEGDFHESFFLEVSNTDFFIDASDSKTRELIEKYGEDVLGLTPQSLEQVRVGIVAPELIRRLRLHFQRVLS